jgi:hypothetical protein
MDWKELYPRPLRPKLPQIAEYLAADVLPLFMLFNRTLKEEFGLGYVQVAYTPAFGWIYKYGHSGLILVENVCFHDGLFSVEGIDVKNRTSLDQAIGKVRSMFNDGFMERFAAFHQARTVKRKQRSLLKPPNDPGLNRCRWPAAVPRGKLKRLYESDAKGMIDEALLDDIGFTLYTRCAVAREVYELMEKGKIKCLDCGRALDYAEIIECPCGQRYTYRGYRKSFRADNMPRGAASAIFDRFIADWERVRETAEKMRLIDCLIHEFHVSIITGSQHRPVGVNLIQGAKAQVAALIGELAYGQ